MNQYFRSYSCDISGPPPTHIACEILGADQFYIDKAYLHDDSNNPIVAWGDDNGKGYCLSVQTTDSFSGTTYSEGNGKCVKKMKFDLLDSTWAPITGDWTTSTRVEVNIATYHNSAFSDEYVNLQLLRNKEVHYEFRRQNNEVKALLHSHIFGGPSAFDPEDLWEYRLAIEGTDAMLIDSVKYTGAVTKQWTSPFCLSTDATKRFNSAGVDCFPEKVLVISPSANMKEMHFQLRLKTSTGAYYTNSRIKLTLYKNGEFFWQDQDVDCSRGITVGISKVFMGPPTFNAEDGWSVVLETNGGDAMLVDKVVLMEGDTTETWGFENDLCLATQATDTFSGTMTCHPTHELPISIPDPVNCFNTALLPPYERDGVQLTDVPIDDSYTIRLNFNVSAVFDDYMHVLSVGGNLLDLGVYLFRSCPGGGCETANDGFFRIAAYYGYGGVQNDCLYFQSQKLYDFGGPPVELVVNRNRWDELRFYVNGEAVVSMDGIDYMPGSQGFSRSIDGRVYYFADADTPIYGDEIGGVILESAQIYTGAHPPDQLGPCP